MGRMILIAALILLPLQSVTAATRIVRPDGSGDYPTIQAAINAASHGDTIELTGGTFLGEGNRDINFNGRSITVRSRSGDPQACIIDCQGTVEETHRGFVFSSGEGPASVVRDLTITGALVNGC